MIPKHTRTQLTVIAESALEPRLMAELKRHHAHVWTISEVRGAFPEGERSGDWDADRTIELRVICEPATADAIAEAIVEKYAPHYSVVLLFADVQVLRPERF